MYAKDSYNAKYQFLISKRECAGLKIQKLLSNTRMTWVIFKKILKIIIKIKNEK